MSNLDPVVQIGNWYYQVIYGQLWPVDATGADDMVRLEPRLHSLLNYFLLHPGILLAKDTLIEKVWPADEGTDAAVMRAVGALRKVLGDDVRAPSYIETASKKGYRWLATITPAKLQDIAAVSTEDVTVNAVTAEMGPDIKPRSAWRFIAGTATAVIVGCASLAYVLATYTSTPLIKLPDTITPISALSGQEYWPVLTPDNSHVLYQHKAVDSSLFNWSLQNLTDLRVEHMPPKYRQLSQALWLDAEHIIFRAENIDGGCYFYRQHIKPATKPELLWPCQKVLPQGAAVWQQKLLWLDIDTDTNQLQLWSALPGQAAELLLSQDNRWRDISYMLIRNDTLYFVAQQTANQSVLLQLTLPDGKFEKLLDFPYVITQFSWWDERQLLLSAGQQELQIVSLKSNSRQGLGPMTRELTQASRYPGQVLATQFLDYTTDILRVIDSPEISGGVKLLPWHVSNRSERLLAISETGQAAFVSERAGHSQIWLAQERNSTQITRFTEQQHLQQMLWHQQQLLVLINTSLYQLDLASGQLQLYHDVSSAGRYASCHGTLYWTALTADGWVLMNEKANKPDLVMSGVTDVRCGPQQGLVLQFANTANLALLTSAQELISLPVQIDWRSSSGEQWFTDNTGVYWLADNNTAVYRFDWLSQQVNVLLITEQEMPVAIYSNGRGLGYIVRQRPYDTDIVWLQNRR
ncbi:DNA-binding winged helix-turn-helix (wHTH) protein [Rheinheimera pacifica]|uniref:winged helix-turn-helix domain-containing protein n=1 Tax=Rheinheimera pacifica TaxID=173990 RepID=UPI00285E55BF|nr:winged helix-turn-helix domain-containing protein [Rheinheimera pacifica]MDR6981610.1 DNA-binding winged helix-turn-helix (wHTH) protein [Rheinheimera pacifica]